MDGHKEGIDFFARSGQKCLESQITTMAARSKMHFSRLVMAFDPWLWIQGLHEVKIVKKVRCRRKKGRDLTTDLVIYFYESSDRSRLKLIGAG